MIRNDPVEMILRRDAQHVRLRAMHAVTKQFCLARVQQQGQQLLVREGVRRTLQKAPQQIGRGSVHGIASFALMEYGIL